MPFTRVASLLVLYVHLLCLGASCSSGDPVALSEDGPCAALPPNAVRKSDPGQELEASDLGRLTISPGSDHIVTVGDEFQFSLGYAPPAAGLPPGTTLHIIPFPHKRPGTAAASLRGPEGTSAVSVSSDHGYSSRARAQPGGPACFAVPLPDGLEQGATLEFTYEIPEDSVMRAHYTLEGPCSARFTVRVVSPDGRVMGDLPTPSWQFATGPPRRMAVILPSQADVGQEVPMIVRVTEYDAPTFDFDGTVTVEPQAHVELLAEREFPLTRVDAGVKRLKVRFTEPGLYRIAAAADGDFSAVSNPIRVGEADVQPIYWGVMHWHTEYSWDSRNVQPTCFGVADSFRYARDMSMLDFLAVSDHGQHGDADAFSTGDPRMPQVDMLEEDWNAYQAETLEFDESAEDIITFVGYEHRDPRGDTNVVFRGEGRYFIEDGKRLFFDDVWDNAEPDQLLTFPQLHLRGKLEDYRQTSPHERLVEIRSWHAAFEYYLNPQPFKSYNTVEVKHGAPGERVFAQDLLGLGRKLGFVANDDHGDLPGNGGVTAVLAPERSHDAIFDTLLARRVYATTGARMIVDFRMGKLRMGEEARVEPGSALAESRVLSFDIHGTSRIETVAVIRNNETLVERTYGELDVSDSVEDGDGLDAIVEPREVGDTPSAYYYLRVVQDDGQTAWSSPIFLY